MHWADVLIKQGLALLFGISVAIIYRWTRSSHLESRSLMATFVLLAILITIVTSVIGDNVARAFSLVGALSIVRFRTVVADTRDTAFVILAVGIGMALGAGYYFMPLIMIPMAGLASYLFRDKPHDPNRIEVLARTALGVLPANIEAILGTHGKKVNLVGVATTRQGAGMEFTYRLMVPTSNSVCTLVDDLNLAEGIVGVEVKMI